LTISSKLGGAETAAFRHGEEHRFVANVNHVIARRLVVKAKDTGRGIALENLTGIRDRITVSKAQRRNQHSWAFRQLQRHLAYLSNLWLR